MRSTDRWEALRKVIAGADRFLLTTHVFPEGDAIGSEIALALHLRSLNKQVLILNDSPALERYHFLTRKVPILSWSDEGAWPDPDWVEVAICLDASNWDYLGSVGRWIKNAKRWPLTRNPSPHLVSIDHHHVKVPFGDLDVILEDACATGEVLYRYFKAIDAEITPVMAEALYSSILFDTWGFRLPNASNESVRLAAELLDFGVDHRTVSQALFETDSYPKIDLLRLALGTLRTEYDGRLAWLAIPEDLFRATGAKFVDADGILDHLLSLRDVEICVMFRQQENRGVKTTFRSKGRHDVGRLAEELGGGGRATAAGVLLPMPISEAMESVLPRIHEMLADPEEEAGLERPAGSRRLTGIG